MRLLPCGPDAVLVELADLEEVLAAHPLIDAIDGVQEAVPAARTVLARSRPGALDEVCSAIRSLSVDTGTPTAPEREVTIEVVYDGEDLSEVAELTGLTEAEVIEAHTGAPWRVAFGGFAPGFSYLVGGDPRLAVPRKESPRTRVPAGSVGLAGEFSGIYPTASPGGWQLIGRTAAVLFDPSASPPALLAPGTLVRFAARDALGPMRPANPPDGGKAGERGLRVERAQFPLVVVDAGRPGHAAIGVGRSGAADLGFYALGARLVGNERGEAALEAIVGGFAVTARGALTCALTGAPAEASVAGRAVSMATVFTIGDGETLTVGPTHGGLRTYLSVRGGIDVDPVLGSRSRDTLAGLGPDPLGAGDVVPVGTSATGWVPPTDWAPQAPADRAVVLEFTPGPRADWVESLDETTWEVSASVDRVGARLIGAPLARLVEGELPSEPAVRGAIQVPPSGEPVLFLADHPLTVGYPVAGVLTPESADRAAQLRPGDELTLRRQAVP